MKHPDGMSTVIPVHPGEKIGQGFLAGKMTLLNIILIFV